MRLILLIFSIGFAIYGLLPYRKASNTNTILPNQLVIEQQECGCPCPDARIVKGQLQIPADIASKYQGLHTTQLNLSINGFNEPYNYELGKASLFIKGRVVGTDTIQCDPTSCELAPRFEVESWALVDTVANAWIFPLWIGALFLANLLLFAPTIIIIEIVRLVRRSRGKKKQQLT